VTANGETRTMTYDTENLVATVTSNAGTTTYVRDAAGRLDMMTAPSGATVSYEYDLIDQVTAVITTTPNGATETTRYTYDAVGNVETVQDPLGGVTTYTYDDVGRPSTRTLPSGVVSTWVFDVRDRITSVVHTDAVGAVLASESYTRALSGEPTRIEREDGSAVILGYDASLRLTLERVVDDGGVVQRERSYTYDSDGNRLTRHIMGSATEIYTYGSGFRLASVAEGGTTSTYGHDAGGRVNSFGGYTLGYDSMDHVVSASTGASVYNYTYDGERRRIAWSDGVVSRDVLVAPTQAASAPGYESPHVVSDGAGVSVRSYVYDGEHALMRVEGAAPTYYLRDAMGSVIALADASGNRVARFDYDAFGAVQSATGPAASLPADGDFRHHGMWLDPTGLYHVRNRTYDANTGRFTSRDPVEAGDGEPEAWMPYVANRGNPHVWRDPEGLFTLAGISVSLNIREGGNIVQTYTTEEAREAILEGLGSAVGGLIVNAIEGLLPASVPNPIPSGAEFGQEASISLCDALPALATGLTGLHLDAPIGSDGKPLGEGLNCPHGLTVTGLIAGLAALPGGGDTTPDFIYSQRSLVNSVANGHSRSFLVGDFKRQINANYPSQDGRRNQLNAMTQHAADYGSRIVALVSLLHVPHRIERNIESIGVASGVLIVVASP
jgi:RHS repeat-associated protein